MIRLRSGSIGWARLFIWSDLFRAIADIADFGWLGPLKLSKNTIISCLQKNVLVIALGVQYKALFQESGNDRALAAYLWPEGFD